MPSNKGRILCVDDNEDACDLLSALLTRQGYEVTTAGSVAAAKRAVLDARFDLAILDNWMEGGDGPDLCRWVREHSPATRVIFYSAAAFPEDGEAGLEAGAAAYVVKPDVEGLLAAARGALGG